MPSSWLERMILPTGGGLCSPWRAAHSLPPRRRGPCRNEPVCWEHTFFLCLPARLQASLLRSGTNTKKPEDFHLPVLFSGEGGIRTPGSSQINGFQDRRNRPLCHLSFRFGTANIGTIFIYPKLFCIKCRKNKKIGKANLKKPSRWCLNIHK